MVLNSSHFFVLQHDVLAILVLYVALVFQLLEYVPYVVLGLLLVVLPNAYTLDQLMQLFVAYLQQVSCATCLNQEMWSLYPRKLAYSCHSNTGMEKLILKR